MKKQIIINFVLMSFFILEMNAQIGKYCQDFSFSKICYQFEEGNRFQFKDLMCIAEEVGHGKFEIENHKIRFIYEPIDFFENQFAIKKIKALKDSIKIRFRVKDYGKGKILKDYSLFSTKRGEIENELKLYKNQINLKYSGEPIFLNISSNGYSNYTFKIDASGEYEIDLFLKEGIDRDIYEMKEGIEEFTIIEMTKDKIVLKSKKSDYELELRLEE